MKKLGYKTIPEGVDIRSGYKVSWRYYKTREEAEAAAEIAKHNAKIDADQGYDFGYCCPGDIMLCEFEGRYKGLYEVCFS